MVTALVATATTAAAAGGTLYDGVASHRHFDNLDLELVLVANFHHYVGILLSGLVVVEQECGRKRDALRARNP